MRVVLAGVSAFLALIIVYYSHYRAEENETKKKHRITEVGCLQNMCCTIHVACLGDAVSNFFSFARSLPTQYSHSFTHLLGRLEKIEIGHYTSLIFSPVNTYGKLRNPSGGNTVTTENNSNKQQQNKQHRHRHRHNRSKAFSIHTLVPRENERPLTS